MNTYRKLLKYTSGKNHYALISALFSALSSIILILSFWFLWKFLNEFLVNNDLDNSKDYAIKIIILMITNTIVYFFALWASHLLGFRLESNLRKEGAKNLMSASFAFFDVNSSGKIRKLIDDNAVETHMIVAHLIPDNIGAILTPILMTITMFIVDFRLGVLLIVITLIGATMIKAMIGNQEFMKLYTESLERMNSEAVEYVRGMQVVKIFRSTVYSFKSFYNSIMEYSKHAYGHTMSSRIPYVSFQVIFNIVVALTIPFAIIYLNRGESSMEILSKVIFFACFAGQMFVSLMKVMYVGMYQFLGYQAVDKLENLFEEMKKDGLEYGSLENLENYDIEFRNVSFRYDEDYVIKELNLKLKGNRTYAIVGSSGGGKSTIAKLISGFYKVDGGEILIGGKNITDYSQRAIMDNIAFVFQNSKLFKTTIFENVKIGKSDATYEEVMEALRKAKCMDILEKFADKENTVIGSKGVHLSGGEIQRIAIARAILKDANIVILDEASAATDPENEYEIQQAFTNLMKDKTVIMIAHRLSSIRRADDIIVIDDGKVIERGTDRELMEKKGKYRKLQEMFSEANRWRVYD